MIVTFEKVDKDNDKQAVADWLVNESWPYHVNKTLTRDQIFKLMQDGDLLGGEQLTFWIHIDFTVRIGLLTVFNLNQEDVPRLDLRIKSQYRNRGIGRRSVHWVTSYLFSSMPALGKVEGTTRSDNIPMARAFEYAGFTKEGHLRRSWPAGNLRKDTLIFGILREEWARGTPSRADSSDRCSLGG